MQDKIATGCTDTQDLNHGVRVPSLQLSELNRRSEGSSQATSKTCAETETLFQPLSIVLELEYRRLLETLTEICEVSD